MTDWTGLTPEQKSDLRQQMRVPFLAFVGLLVMLAINIATGWFQPFPDVWILNLCVLILMIATVLLFSMEVIHEPALIRFFSVLGFCWVMILVTMVLIDYTSR